MSNWGASLAKRASDDFDDLLNENAAIAAEFDSEIFIPDSFDSTQQDLSDRQALRRVAGLSTELSDISEAEYRQLRLERVVLIGVWTHGSAKQADNSMAELAALAETAGSQVLEALVQRRDKPDPATFIGSGKVSE
ncbi:MAG: GTPase HflX, partial [Betaproteobacteria bacterium]|nr:GTPase HflX [Betaproteobacteria bacterium]